MALENGALLSAAEEAGFDLLITCDQNVPHQQNFTSRRLVVVVLSSNHWPTLRRVAAKIATASISFKSDRSLGLMSPCCRRIGGPGISLAGA